MRGSSLLGWIPASPHCIAKFGYPFAASSSQRLWKLPTPPM
jgi:hypothetical protein